MTRLTILIASLMLIYTPALTQIIINELSSKNDEYLKSSDGEFHDWVELYNSSSLETSLKDYYLSDDIEELDKWRFPNISIPSNEYLIIFCSDKDNIIDGELHTNFKLTSDGETIYLTNGQSILDSMKFGKINEDYSYGRLEESSNVKTNLAIPTPGRSNRISGTIIPSKESGFYQNEFDLELKTAEGLKIYYTTNGDDPTIESQQYVGKIEIKDEYDEYEYLSYPTAAPDSVNCRMNFYIPETDIPRCSIISYCVIDDVGNRSKIYRQSFFFHNNHSLPIASIITDNRNLFSQDSGIFVPGDNYEEDIPCWTGNYFQRGWEKSATITYFEEGNNKLEEDIGLQIHGETTRTSPQKSLRISARKEYGVNKLKNVFFDDAPVDEFNSLVLRSTMACMSHTLFKDALTLSCINNLDHEKTYVKPTVVYINGNYWGLSELRNRLDEDYLSDKYDIREDSINIVSLDNIDEKRHGSYDEFRDIYNFVVDNDLSDDENYKVVESYLNIDNFIDYYLAEMYFANYDWPGSNYLIWNGAGEQKKYENLFFDIDAGWEVPEYDMFEHTNELERQKWPNPRSKNIFQQSLFSNSTFRNKFIYRALILLETEFSFETVKSKIDSFLVIYGSEIDNYIERFGFPENRNVWMNNIEEDLINFARERECYFRKNMKEFFDLSDDLLCVGTTVESNFNRPPTISPNPASTNIRIENITSNNIRIYDIHGREMLVIDCENESSLEVNISNFSPSIYFIKMSDGVFKFIKN
jgi:hypothetical protein